MFIVYNIILSILLFLFWPLLLWYLYRRQGNLEGLGERLVTYGWFFGFRGLFFRRPAVPHSERGAEVCPSLWFHGASVGEVRMLVPLLRARQAEYPETALLLTTMTLTGRQTARQAFPEAKVVLMPLDLPCCWALFFRYFQPAALIIAETELWPNLFDCVRRRRLPLALVNARLSRKSFVNYQIFNFFTKKMFGVPDVVVVQDRVSAARFAGLGTPVEKIIFSGNLKFDLLPPPERKLKIGPRTLLGPEIQLVVAGSTHPGEEELILSAWNENIADNGSNNNNNKPLSLVLAPRHPQRFAAVAKLLDDRGIDYLRFSEIKDSLVSGPVKVPAVLLLDTLGDLIHFYRRAGFTIIGGTLVPGIGGHNPLEAALFAKAVIHGPYVANFKDGFELLDEAGGGLPVADGRELALLLGRCLNDREFIQSAGLKAQATVERNRGAVQRTLQALIEKGIFR